MLYRTNSAPVLVQDGSAELTLEGDNGRSLLGCPPEPQRGQRLLTVGELESTAMISTLPLIWTAMSWPRSSQPVGNFDAVMMEAPQRLSAGHRLISWELYAPDGFFK